MKRDTNENELSGGKENIVGKGENAGYQHFHLFLSIFTFSYYVFKRLHFQGHENKGLFNSGLSLILFTFSYYVFKRLRFQGHENKGLFNLAQSNIAPDKGWGVGVCDGILNSLSLFQAPCCGYSLELFR